MSRLVYVIASLLVVVCGRAAGQHPAIPDARAGARSPQTGVIAEPGDRVRIRFRAAEQAALVGTVAAADSLGFLLRPEGGGESLMIGRDSLRSLEVSRGVHSSTGRGAGIGLLVGGLAGAVTGFALGSDNPGGGCYWCFSAGQKAAAGAILGAPVGAVVGLIIGASTRHERWAKVSTERVAIRVRPGSGGAIVALAVPF